MCAVLTLCLSKPSSLILIDVTLESFSKVVQAVTCDSQLFKIGNPVILKTVGIFLDEWDMALKKSIPFRQKLSQKINIVIASSSFRLRNSLQKSIEKLGVKAGKI